jgi:hypothetical protein
MGEPPVQPAGDAVRTVRLSCPFEQALQAEYVKEVQVGAGTVTVASPYAAVFATLLARTWKVPGTPGAVYRPDVVTVPTFPGSTMLQLTAVFAVPVTTAAKACVPRAATVAESGWTATATDCGEGPGCTGVLSGAEEQANDAARDARRATCLTGRMNFLTFGWDVP